MLIIKINYPIDEPILLCAKIKDFLCDTEDAILGKLACSNEFDLIDLQRNEWLAETRLLKKILPSELEGYIIFEYSIPRLGKRIDVVLLSEGIVFVLEFKVGANNYFRSDLEQVWDYAIDLKNFHEASHELTIVPILIATEAAELAQKQLFNTHKDFVLQPLCCNTGNLSKILLQIIQNYGKRCDLSRWAESRYMPTPTIIQAASALYLNHSVDNITRAEASGESLKKTSEFVMGVIEQAKTNREKSICFVTGVPGAGKTLVGLNIAVKQFEKKPLLFIFLAISRLSPF